MVGKLSGVLASLVLAGALLGGCTSTGGAASGSSAGAAASTANSAGHASASSAGDASAGASGQSSAGSAASGTSGSGGTQSASAASTATFDPYATATRYDVDESMFATRTGVDYGTIDADIAYYSTTAGDYKRCNVLLPAGYDPAKKYPVMYAIHGFGGAYSDIIAPGTFLVTLYGNMLADGLAEPQIIVGVDMYTDVQADKAAKTDEQLRFIYDKVVDDIAVDLMPFISGRYSVAEGRANTAVTGFSQGGAEALCTGFKRLDTFGYIAGFAPDTGVIPTEYFLGTFWNTPYFERFPAPNAGNTPYYLYMSVGSNDPWNVDCTRYYAQVLNDMGVRNQTDVVPGFAHDELFWRQCYYNMLSKTFKG